MAAVLLYPPFWVAVGEAILFVGSAVVAAVVVNEGIDAISDAMSDAEAEAQAREQTGTATDVCTTCGDPPPECKDLNDKIKQRRDKLAKRYNDFREDNRGLYDNHYYKSQAHPTFGSWVGHVEQYQGVQRSLRKLLKAARALGCPTETEDAGKWSSNQPPSQPGP